MLIKTACTFWKQSQSKRTTDGEHAEVIQIAEWANEDKSELQPIEPRRTGAVFGLDAETAAAVVSAEPIAPNDDV